MKQSQIYPISPSYRRVLAKGGRITPRNMDGLLCSHDQHQSLQNIALDIFTDCTNAGIPFQEAIGAIYLSGLQHGSELQKVE